MGVWSLPHRLVERIEKGFYLTYGPDPGPAQSTCGPTPSTVPQGSRGDPKADMEQARIGAEVREREGNECELAGRCFSLSCGLI